MEKNQAAGAGEHVYEDIEPLAEWVSEPEFDTLIVYLPGNSTRILQILFFFFNKKFWYILYQFIMF